MTNISPVLEREHSAHSLRRDVRFLGEILGQVLIQQCGQHVFEAVEKIREMTKSLRMQFDSRLFSELQKTIDELDSDTRHQVIRAFALYFQLVNIAEQNHRIRRKREYELDAGEKIQPGSIESAILDLKEKGFSAREVQDILQSISLELVMTAHPTEAMRRAVLDIHQRIARELEQLDRPDLTHKEREKLLKRLQGEVLTLWQTDELRDRKPTVLDEVRNGLYYFDHTLFQVIPEVYEELERCLNKYYPEQSWELPLYLRFGSWIGGDRDGNPSVTADVTWITLQLHRELALKKYEQAVREMMGRFSFSGNIVPISDELLESIERDKARVELKAEDVWRNEKEAYRIKWTYILQKIMNTRLGKTKDKLARYNDPEELIADLEMIERSLRGHHADVIADTWVKKLIRQVKLFGFHTATLDIRQHSKEHEAAVAEILAKMGVEPDYAGLKETQKIQLLLRLLDDPRPLTSPYVELSEGTRECLNVFQTIRKAQEEFGPHCIRSYLISMTQGASDLLEVLLLGKEFGLYRKDQEGKVHCTLQPVPLFETIDDLHAAPNIMRTLFDLPLYLKTVQARDNIQEIMLGYSDSNKDGGVMAASWELRLALKKIAKVAGEYGIKTKFFHGRGGALGRGGMPLNRSILAQPADTIGGGIKITEQGEVLSSRYLFQGIAYRSLEQATSALITLARWAKSPKPETVNEQWETCMNQISEASLRKYQDLIFRDPEFLAFFKESTPLPEIGELNIGSRPAKRKNSDRFEDLRAIPWVFAWTQSRFLFPAWYAAGTGLLSYYQNREDRMELLRDMYRNWSFFRLTIDNLQMALAKADMLIAEQYAKLAHRSDQAQRIFRMIKDEYELTTQLILKITGQKEILENVPVIQESIRLRNPYVDPLSYMQVKLIAELRKRREQQEEDADVLRQVLLTINGIAAGLRNTG